MFEKRSGEYEVAGGTVDNDNNDLDDVFKPDYPLSEAIRS